MKDKSLYAIIISCVAILIAGFSAFSLSFDIESSSFPLGCLTLLVTLLIGWNIYVSLDTKQLRQIAKKEAEQAAFRVNKSTNGFVLFLQGEGSYQSGDIPMAIHRYIIGLQESNQGSNEYTTDVILQRLGIIASEHNNNPIPILIGNRNLYVSILAKIEDERAKTLIGYIIKAKELTSNDL